MTNQTSFKDWQGNVINVEIDNPIVEFKNKEELKFFILDSLESYIENQMVFIGDEFKLLFYELGVYINYFYLDNKEMKKKLFSELRTISKRFRQKTVVDGPFDRSMKK